jgi:hypothetical protein
MRALGYVSVPEAEKRTNIPKSSIYDALKRGDIEYKVERRRHYLKVTSLLEFGGESARTIWATTEAR